MDNYNDVARHELINWKKHMKKKPSIIEAYSKEVQNKFNNILPEKYHEVMTVAIKNMTKAVLYGSKYVTKPPYEYLTLREREDLLIDKTLIYKKTAKLEGAGTGAGGLLLGLADLPILLGIKVKFLYDVAAIYGFDVNDYKERIYILNIIQLAFSSKKHINEVFNQMENWNEYIKTLPEDINEFDWRTFQQQYRDYLDLAKFFQLMPGIGAFVGFYVNGKLIDKLSETAMFAYRMRMKELE